MFQMINVSDILMIQLLLQLLLQVHQSEKLIDNVKLLGGKCTLLPRMRYIKKTGESKQ